MKYIYREYFQKSFVFLYPLLKLRKYKHFRPASVYMFHKDYCGEKLYCVFKQEKTLEWTEFEQNILLGHSMLHMCHPVGKESMLYVFDYSIYKKDFYKVKEGKYSLLSPETKRTIIDYYGVRSPLFVYIESFLYPDKYYEKFAECLKVNVDLLRKGVQLCEKPDIEKEICEIEIKDIEIINN